VKFRRSGRGNRPWRLSEKHGPVMFVASNGGHLAELVLLRERMTGITDEVWVAGAGEQVRALIGQRRFIEGPSVPPRSPARMLIALPAALRILLKERPRLVISTGAAIALPFFALAALFGCRIVYVESAARTHKPSLTGRLISVLPRIERFAQNDGLGLRWPTLGSSLESFRPVPKSGKASESLRVVVTVGTMEFPFDRLIATASKLIPAQAHVTWQIGHSAPPLERNASLNHVVKFLNYEDLHAALTEADVVICHAGIGTCLLAFELGKKPVVLARRHALSEHVDNHQVETAEALSQRSLVFWWDEQTFTPSEWPSHVATEGVGKATAGLFDIRVTEERSTTTLTP
jgi:UDP-N-acetylglucosamine--N-acetylmuramyl-(pentapeptide) pyrophosphoryl-undecaprenol N-acetylglucosamine transferase